MVWPFDNDPQQQAANVDPNGGLGAGGFFGGGMFSPAAVLADPAYRRMAAFDALTHAGLGLIQASAPSRTPQDFGTAFGALAGGAAEGANSSLERYMKLGMAGAQMRNLQMQNAAYTQMLNQPQQAPYSPYGDQAQPQQQAGASGGGPNDPAGAIAGIESGGNYQAVGPAANEKGNRAYGKYQVMDFNVAPWTKEVLGKAMTPQEFLANPQAQDAVFNAKYGQYTQKYGPQGAPRAWFAGETGMNNPNATDVNGMSVSRYGQLAQAGGAPVGGDLPPFPTNPPDKGRYANMEALGGPFKARAEALYAADVKRYETAKAMYEAAVERRKIRNSEAQLTVNPVSGQPQQGPIEAAAQKAAAEEKAKAGAHADYVMPPGFMEAKTPEAKLAMLPKNIRGVVEEFGPNGDLALSELPARMGSSGLDPSKIDMVGITKAVYGDQFDLRQKELRKDFLTNVYAGNKPEGGTRLALITGFQHLDTFAQLVKAQANSDMPAWNNILKHWNDQSGNPRFSSAEALMQFLAPEAAKVVKGGGQLNEKEVEDNKEQLMTTKSWPQARAILQTWHGAMLARKNGLEDTARSLGVPQTKIDKLWGTGAEGKESAMTGSIKHFNEVTAGEAPQQSLQMPMIGSPEEARKLPKGTQFRFMQNGKEHVGTVP